MRIITRKKVLVVPYTFLNDKIRFLMFQDTNSKDWTLMSGGCKTNENAYDSAKRELLEESNGTLNLPLQYEYFTFWTNYRPWHMHVKEKKKGVKVLSLYHVFLYEFKESEFNLYKETYHNSLIKNKETSNMALFSFSDILDKNKQVWDFIRDISVPYLQKYFVKNNRYFFC